MPTYEYICQDCGETFECKRSYEEADEAINCFSCNSLNTKRALSRIFVRNESGSLTKSNPSCCGCSAGSCASCNH